MSVYVLNELLAALQKHRDAENLFLPENQQLPPYNTEDVLQIIQSNPQLLQDTVNEILQDQNSFIESDMSNQDIGTYLTNLHDQWRLLPSELHVQEADYKAIKQYFERKIGTIDMSESQLDLLNSLSIPFENYTMPEKKGLKYVFYFVEDAIKSYNRREQVLHRLINDGILDEQVALQLPEIDGGLPPRWSYGAVHESVPMGGNLNIEDLPLSKLARRIINHTELKDITDFDDLDEQSALNAARKYINDKFVNDGNFVDDDMADFLDENWNALIDEIEEQVKIRAQESIINPSGAGDIELQPIGKDKAEPEDIYDGDSDIVTVVNEEQFVPDPEIELEAKTIFEKYFSPGDTFEPTELIMKATGLPRESIMGKAKYDQLFKDLLDVYMDFEMGAMQIELAELQTNFDHSQIAREITEPSKREVEAWLDRNGYSLPEDKLNALLDDVSYEWIKDKSLKIANGEIEVSSFDSKGIQDWASEQGFSLTEEQLQDLWFIADISRPQKPVPPSVPEPQDPISMDDLDEPGQPGIKNAEEELENWKLFQQLKYEGNFNESQLRKMVYEFPGEDAEFLLRELQGWNTGRYQNLSLDEIYNLPGKRGAKGYEHFVKVFNDEIQRRNGGATAPEPVKAPEPKTFTDIHYRGMNEEEKAAFLKDNPEELNKLANDVALEYKNKLGADDNKLQFDPQKAIRQHNATSENTIPESAMDLFIRPLQDKYYSNFTQQDILTSYVAAEGQSAANNIGVSGDGTLFARGSFLGGWLEKQVKTLKYAPAQYVFNQYLTGLIGQEGTEIFNLAMSVTDLVFSGDPIPLILTGVFKLVDIAGQQYQRKVDRDDPYANKHVGTWAMVKNEATGEWQPAKITAVEPWDGNKNAVTFSTGKDLVFFNDGNYFADGTDKEYILTDDELNNANFNLSSVDYRKGESWNLGSKEYIDDVDFMRQWFFIPPDQLQAWFSGETEDYPITGFKDTYSNAYMQQLTDWQRISELSHSYRNEYLKTVGDRAADKDLYDNTRDLRRIWDEKNRFQFLGAADMDVSMDDIRAVTNESGFYWSDKMPENKLLLDEWIPDMINDLVYAQRAAAYDAGFNEQNSKYTAFDDDNLGMAFTKESKYANGWHSHYADPLYIPTASNADELALQFNEIDGLDNRSAAQKYYLKSRSETRYWLNQLNERGGTDAFMSRFTGHDVGPDNPNEKPQISYMVSNSFLSGNNMPWSYVGETSFLPEDIDYDGEWNVFLNNYELQNKQTEKSNLWTDAFETIGDETPEEKAARLLEEGGMNIAKDFEMQGDIGDIDWDPDDGTDTEQETVGGWVPIGEWASDPEGPEKPTDSDRPDDLEWITIPGIGRVPRNPRPIVPQTKPENTNAPDPDTIVPDEQPDEQPDNQPVDQSNDNNFAPDPDVHKPLKWDPSMPEDEDSDLFVAPEPKNEFERYLKEEHMAKFLELHDFPGQYHDISKDFAKDMEGNIILGKGDEGLEKQLGVSDEIDALEDSSGNIVTFYDAYKYQPTYDDTHTQL